MAHLFLTRVHNKFNVRCQHNNKVKVRYKITALAAILHQIQIDGDTKFRDICLHHVTITGSMLGFNFNIFKVRLSLAPGCMVHLFTTRGRLD